MNSNFASMGKKSSSSASGSRRSLIAKRTACNRPPVPKPAPWLVFQYGNDKKYHAFYNPCEPNNKTCTKFIRELSGNIYWQKPCHQGWLVILDLDQADCFMWNPVSLKSVKLPNLLQWVMNYYFIDCVLNLPMSNNVSRSTVYFLLKHQLTSEILLLYSQPGAKQWRSMCLDEYYEDLNNCSVRCLHYLKGKLYVFCRSLWQLEIELKHGRHYNDQTLSIRRFQVKGCPVLQHAAGSTCSLKSYQVESFDDIFQVNISYSIKNLNKPGAPATVVQVQRLDLSLMAWVEVKSLGDDVLFIGGENNASCSAADMALKRGCVFYTAPEDKSLNIFEPEDDGITVIFPFSKLPTPWFSGDWIMIPTLTRRTGGRKRTENLLGGDGKEGDCEITQLAEKVNKTCLGDSYVEFTTVYSMDCQFLGVSESFMKRFRYDIILQCPGWGGLVYQIGPRLVFQIENQ
ncbi:hypothetical protein C5167_018742 [Papaver somniferum]|uniref:KIB1-4 beta-propeller domain-containing protein n=1 Tax=Papaver somniferum TaxID=3469 RepID=A0A4Y7IQA3_PAPSO|nr:hypothetical protein C5167_018742 [Papaver somniferum]